MDSIHLLAREDEFKKLNKELEKKSEKLLKEIEYVMQKQDIFSDFSHNLNQNVSRNVGKHSCDLPQHHTTSIVTKPKKKTTLAMEQNNKLNLESAKQSQLRTNGKNHSTNSEVINKSHNVRHSTNCDPNQTKCNNRVCDFCIHSKNEVNVDLEFLYAFVSVNVKDKVLPQSFSKDRVTVESVCKFLSSKVKLMQEQIDKLQNTIDKKASQCEAHLTQLAELESERMKLLNNANNMKASTADMRAKCMALQKRFDEKDKLFKEQRSETDKLVNEIKRLRSKYVTTEARCASQEEIIDNLKQQVEVSKRTEKEFRDSSRSLSASHQSAICRLEAQIKTLSSRIDKQNSLIGNLRKQNAILCTEGAVKALEREYCNFLSQDF